MGRARCAVQEVLFPVLSRASLEDTVRERGGVVSGENPSD